MKDTLGNFFTLTYEGILSNWESVEVRVERVKALLEK